MEQLIVLKHLIMTIKIIMNFILCGEQHLSYATIKEGCNLKCYLTLLCSWELHFWFEQSSKKFISMGFTLNVSASPLTRTTLMLTLKGEKTRISWAAEWACACSSNPSTHSSIQTHVASTLVWNTGRSQKDKAYEDITKCFA